MTTKDEQQNSVSNFSKHDAVTFLILTPLFLTASWYLVTWNSLYGILLALITVPISIIAIRDKKGITKVTVMTFILFFFWAQFLPRYFWELKLDDLNLINKKLNFYAQGIRKLDDPPKHNSQYDRERMRYNSMKRSSTMEKRYDLSDPFSKTKRTLMYFEDSKNWLLWSAGPDQDYDMPANWVRNRFDYLENENPNWLITNTYDPTNGVKSSGDLWRSNIID